MKTLLRILLACLFLAGIVGVAKLNERDTHPKRGGGGCDRVPSLSEIEAAQKRGEDPMKLCKTSK